MAKISPAKFSREVRQEFNKVTWPTRKEAVVTTVMVFVFVVLMAIFFLLVDAVSSTIIQMLLDIGR